MSGMGQLSCRSIAVRGSYCYFDYYVIIEMTNSYRIFRPIAARKTRRHRDRETEMADELKAVTSALAGGDITPGEAGRIAGVVDTFVRAIETSDFDRRLQGLENKLNAPTTAGNAATGSGWHYNR